MFTFLHYLLDNPFVVLYCLQAFTYSVAATSARHAGHKGLTRCYATSALLHGLLGACHFMHLN